MLDDGATPLHGRERICREFVGSCSEIVARDSHWLAEHPTDVIGAACGCEETVPDQFEPIMKMRVWTCPVIGCVAVLGTTPAQAAVRQRDPLLHQLVHSQTYGQLAP